MSWGKKSKVQPSGKKSKRVMVKVDGIVQQRRCRDVVFLFLFFCYWVVMFYLAYVAIGTDKAGNPNKLIWPKDSLGYYCGYNNKNAGGWNDYSSLPYLYYVNPTEASTTNTFCVSACPSSTKLTFQSTSICQSPFSATTLTASAWDAQVAASNCTNYVYATKAVLYRCLPTESIATSLTGTNSAGSSSTVTISSTSTSISWSSFTGKTAVGMQALADLMTSWPLLAIGVGAAMFLSFFWVVLLRLFSKVFIWVSIVLSNVGLCGAAVWLYFYWKSLSSSTTTVSSTNVSVTTSSTASAWEISTAQGVFIGTAIIAGVILLITIFLARRLKLAIELIKDTGRALVSMPLLLLFPMFIYVLVGGLGIYFVYVSLYILTIEESLTLPLVSLGVNSNLKTYFEYFHLFGFLWGIFFLLGISDVTIAGSIANFYWLHDKNTRLNKPIGTALWRTLRYHLGSICLGSLIIALVDLIRIFVWQIQRQARASNNIVLKYVLGCVQCCLGFLNKIVKLINKNAFIQMAITGKSFCKSAKSAVALLVSNSLKLLVVNLITSYILFISKVAISGLCGLAAYFYLKTYTPWTLNYTFVPVAFVIFESFVIANIFLNVYNVGIDTLFICFLDDLHENDGSPERPYHMSSALQKIANINNMPAMTQVKQDDDEEY